MPVIVPPGSCTPAENKRLLLVAITIGESAADVEQLQGMRTQFQAE